uniref:ES1A protein n=1 Tax=Hordeum vulgare TaxID=4513 RepID=Q40049_HORVU|nr:ES1A [Hordeum vulgare subsp. vulgare]
MLRITTNEGRQGALERRAPRGLTTHHHHHHRRSYYYGGRCGLDVGLFPIVCACVGGWTGLDALL